MVETVMAGVSVAFVVGALLYIWVPPGGFG